MPCDDGKSTLRSVAAVGKTLNSRRISEAKPLFGTERGRRGESQRGPEKKKGIPNSIVEKPGIRFLPGLTGEHLVAMAKRKKGKRKGWRRSCVDAKR